MCCNSFIIICSIFKALGCPHGCGDGVRSQLGDHLRSKGHNCLQRLQHINPLLFRMYLRDTVRRCPIQETVDFLHAFLGFCVDPSYILQQGTSSFLLYISYKTLYFQSNAVLSFLFQFS